MDFLITKASDDEWYDLRYFDDLQELMEFFDKGKHRLIIDRNYWTADQLRKFGPVNWRDDAEDIAHCQYELHIYDDYIE